MRKTLLAGTILGLLATGVSAQSKAAEQSVFGLSLGEKLAMPECPHETKGGVNLYIDTSAVAAFDGRTLSKQTCFEHWDTALVGQPARTEKVGIEFPEGESPSIAAKVSALVIDGLLESVFFSTAGFSTQDQVLVALRKKYGTPTKTSETKKQNALGAVFSSHFAVWKFANLTVEFRGTTDQIDDGLVNIDTKKGTDYRSSLLKKSQNGPKL